MVIAIAIKHFWRHDKWGTQSRLSEITFFQLPCETKIRDLYFKRDFSISLWQQINILDEVLHNFGYIIFHPELLDHHNSNLHLKNNNKKIKIKKKIR